MTHKKQEFELLQRTLVWNTTRGNTPDTLDWSLELDMLQEELDELRLAVSQNDEVGCFDALLDLKFVLTGTLGKMALTPPQIVDGYSAVLSANETKSSTKNADGKITKPIDFQGPEPRLQSLLDER
jgi:predicted HAD superfamily Cof-like phosphohydrolase